MSFVPNGRGACPDSASAFVTWPRHGLPPIRSMSAPMLMPCGTADAATCSLSTGSGSSRWAASATSGNPALRSTSTTCCLVRCTATTKTLAAVRNRHLHTIQLPGQGSTGRPGSDAEEGPANQGSPARTGGARCSSRYVPRRCKKNWHNK